MHQRRRYGLSALVALCGHAGIAATPPFDGVEIGLPWHVVRADGVYLAPLPSGLTAGEVAVLRAHPLGDDGTPALPLPFTEHELAAFLLCGGGSFVRDAVAHTREMPPGTRPAREALIRARWLCRQAERRFGIAHAFRGRDDGESERDYFAAMDAQTACTQFQVNGAVAWLLRLDRDGQTEAPPVQQQQTTGSAPAARKHRLGRDLLAPVIERARAAVADSADTAQVMAELERMARLPESEIPAPLAGVTSGGVHWRDGGKVNVLTRKALGQRLKRTG